jgi:endonuclease/exonuclease/phosphatase family metal-dependent hydrolase
VSGGSIYSIVSWNCFGAAQNPVALLRWKGAPRAHRFRHPWLRSALSAEDIVCVQELFVSDAEELFEALPLAHQVRDHNLTRWWPLTVGGSGLGVASRHPITTTSMRAYSRPHAGFERFARKGMLHARVMVGGAELDVVTTHLQSGEGEAERRVRERHLRELRALVDELGDDGRAVVLCGDFNINGRAAARGAEYVQLTTMFPDFEDLGARDDSITYHPHPLHNGLAHDYDQGAPEQRIDYVLFRPPARGRSVEATHLERFLDGEMDAFGEHDATHASDHFALRLRVRVG